MPGPFGATLDHVPDYVGCHPSVLPCSILQNPPERFSLTDARIAELDIYKSLAPIRHRHRSYPSALALGERRKYRTNLPTGSDHSGDNLTVDRSPDEALALSSHQTPFKTHSSQ
jgi:hypothetical protein